MYVLYFVLIKKYNSSTCMGRAPELHPPTLVYGRRIWSEENWPLHSEYFMF